MTAPVRTSAPAFDDNVPEGCDPMPGFVGTAAHVWKGNVGQQNKRKINFTLERHYPFSARNGEQVFDAYYKVELWEAAAEAYDDLIEDGARLLVYGEPRPYEEEYVKRNETEIDPATGELKKTMARGIKLISVSIDRGYSGASSYAPSNEFDDDLM